MEWEKEVEHSVRIGRLVLSHLTARYPDLFQSKQDFDKAIPLFRKAVETGKDPYQVNYGRISIASCYLAQRKFKEATPDIEAILSDAQAPADLKEGAQRIAALIKKQSTETEAPH